jgi:hypothetical protein
VTVLEALAVLVAGVAAGAINTVVGSGTLITFPVLLAVGFPPVTANVSNAIGLVLGSVSGAIGYRRELQGQRATAIRLGAASTAGAVLGAVLLLVLPSSAFESIVPGFVALALVLVVAQPWISRRLEARGERPRHGGAPAIAVAGVTGVYGGYFGAAQGIILIGALGSLLPDDLHRVNALKNVLAGAANLAAGLVFVFAAHVAWDVVGLLAVGSVAGAQLAARYGRRLSPTALRGLIVVVGLTAIVQLVF